jgi:hypothetical protein
MAQLTQKEFHQVVSILADELGLQRLRDRLVQRNGLVTRRGVKSVDSLANQIYMLSSGLRRQVPAAIAFQSVWGESLHDKIGEEGEKNLETLADAVNACLGDHDEILADKQGDLDKAIVEYEKALSAAVGGEIARLDMLMKAVPAVAERLRAGGSEQPQEEARAPAASEDSSDD